MKGISEPRHWAWFGIVLFGALAPNLMLAISVRRHRTAFRFAIAGFAGIASTLLISFIWTYPGNVATGNWTTRPTIGARCARNGNIRTPSMR